VLSHLEARHRLTARPLTVGRGVLIDYYEFRKGSYDPFGPVLITPEDIKACAQAQGTDFKYGDIFIIRTGWIQKYNNTTYEERKRLSETKPIEFVHAGVAQSEAMLDFLHDNYFSILVTDNPGFEALPQGPRFIMHQILIPLWGIGIGELFDLERLSQRCKEIGRYDFLFTSSPPNISGEYEYCLHRTVLTVGK
jgi:kynurenine formamidase